MILLDTVVLSELRKRSPSPKVLAWLRTQRAAQLFISVVSLGEIERGIVKVQRTDAGFAQGLAIWLEDTMLLYSDHILPVTAPVARRWGRLSAELGHEGADLLIAATALEHGLTVATRNVRHFKPSGVEVVNPFAAVS
jgi:predicted nucleic acid-binding protein